MLLGDVVASKYNTAFVFPVLLIKFAVLDVTQFEQTSKVDRSFLFNGTSS